MTATPNKLSPGRTIGGLRTNKVGNRNPTINMLVYGQSGIGKTTLAGSADEVPEMRDVLFVDMENGTESLRKSYSNVETVSVKSWAEMQSVYDDLHRGNHPFQTVILDSLSECQTFNMSTIMKELVERKTDEGKVVDPDVPSFREYGKSLTQMRGIIRAFRDLPMHTIFTALEKTDKDEKTGQVTVSPLLTGRLAQEIGAFLDVVMYYYVKEIPLEGGETETKRILLTRKTTKFIAKDRTGNLPTTIVDPVMGDVFRLMFPTEAAAH